MSDTQQKMAIRTSSESLATKYEVMFDRDIDLPNEWHEEFYVMRQATENDIVNVHFNTCGGATNTISAFQNIVKNSPAHFHGVLEGVGYSAGSAMFLLCDTQEVGDFAEMMIHTAQITGGYAHSQGYESRGAQTGRVSRLLVETVYEDFLSEEEIEDVLKGAEIWLDSTEIRSRLEKRDEIRQERERKETMSSYTLETLAAQYLDNLKEDCKYLDYDIPAVLETMGSILDSDSDVINVEDVVTKVKGTQIGKYMIHIDGSVQDMFDKDILFNCKNTPEQVAANFKNATEIKMVADIFEVSYNKYSTKEKVAEALLDFVQEIVDSMNN